MSGLVGMVARRDGVDLGVVCDLWTCPSVAPADYPSRMALVRGPDGAVKEVDPHDKGVTFHPAAPAEAPLDPFRLALCSLLGVDQVAAKDDVLLLRFAGRRWRDSAEGDALRSRLRTTLGLPADASDEGIVEAVRGLVEQAIGSPSVSALADELRAGGLRVSVEDGTLVIHDPPKAAPKATPEGPAMTSEPPPPAPEGEERWYLARSPLDDGWTHLLVRGGEAIFCGEQSLNDWGAAWALKRFTGPGGSLRSVHPVLPPLWAEDAWTTKPLPAAPEAGSVWWGWVSADGDIVEVLEQASSGFRSWSKKGYGPGKKRLCSVWTGNATLRASEAADPGARRTVSRIARPEWCR